MSATFPADGAPLGLAGAGSGRGVATSALSSSWSSKAVAVVVGAGSLVLALGEQRFRTFEAGTLAGALGGLQVADAHRVGTAVVFPQGDRYVGLNLTTGCTAALLLIPFFAVTAGLVGWGRITVRRGLTALGLTTAAVLAVTFTRLLVLWLSIHVWGFEDGYERGHVLLGSVVSTLGLVVGILIYVRLLGRDGRRDGRRTDAEAAR